METYLDKVLVVTEGDNPVAVKIFDRKKHCVITFKLDRYSLEDEQRLLEDAIRLTPAKKKNVEA